MLRIQLPILSLEKTKRIITAGVLSGLLLSRATPIYADDPPAPPSQPSQPTAPQQPSAPSQPNQPSQPTPPTSNQTHSNSDTTAKDKPAPTVPQPTQPQSVTQSPNSTSASPAPSPTPTGTSNGATVGDTSIKTGSASNNTDSVTKANNNTSVSPQITQTLGETKPTPTGKIVENAGNGAGSTSAATDTTSTNNTTAQNNTGTVNNSLNQEAVTGKNDTSLNTGNSAIKTGNANTSATAITSLNTNTNGVMINQFDVNDNRNGDIVLNFGSLANCIAGCGVDSPNVVRNVVNGAGSNNNASASSSANNTTFQNNDATVGSNITLHADSGNNNANDNTGGNSAIKTGNANTQANVLTFANNNIDGKVVYTTVNIYGNLVGDIIMPQSAMDAVPSASPANAANIANGSGSSNDASASSSANNTTFQNNDADIVNNLQLSAATGNNHENNDTGGSASVQTGQSNVNAKVLNIANSNIAGGDIWLVIINEAGKWIGKILGAPDGSHSAASGDVTLTTDSNGNVTASNNGNGAGSTNNASNNSSSKATTSQNNKAKIVNNITLSSNTGGNNANNNTNGNSTIQTGDANIIANLVNFVNNNVKGTGKLFVTVVNVFGTWIGDFVTPGQQKQHTVSQADIQTQTLTTPTVTLPPTVNTQTQEQTAQTNALTASYYQPQPYYMRYPNYLHTKEKYIPTHYANFYAFNSNVLSPKSQAVAGARIEKKAVRVNLAWLLFISPLIGVSIYLKKRLFIYK